MKTKLFTVELVADYLDSRDSKNSNRSLLANLEEQINQFLRDNQEFKTVEWLQSSAAGNMPFTRLTAVLKTA